MANDRWSYRTRCGEEMAANLLREMTPMTATAASKIGLVDLVYERHVKDPIPLFDGPDWIAERTVALMMWKGVSMRCAPWCYERDENNIALPTSIETMPINKVRYFASSRADFSLPPLLNFRCEELSQMLLDCHHPTRSQRYHTRRKAFIRKTKCGKTPSRYAPAIKGLVQDEEHSIDFDGTGPWERGSEWQKFLGEEKPQMLRYSAWTRVVLFPEEEPFIGLPLGGYRYENSLTTFERMMQRIAVCCSSDMSLDFQGLLDRLVAIVGPNHRAHSILPDGPVSSKAHTYWNWVRPQTGRLRVNSAQLGELEQRTALELASIDPARLKAVAPPLSKHVLPPTGDNDANQHLDLPVVPSSCSLDMSVGPSTDTVIDTPPRLPFSRSASPVPGSMDHLGSNMLQEMIKSAQVKPPPPTSRRYSRLNTGHPDLLVRAGPGPSSRVRQASN
jgi:hypothetical protein